MTRKIPKPPDTQRRFPSVWSELAYLCQKTHYWLYVRGEKTKARRYVGRLQWALQDTAENDAAILRAEGAALLAELQGKVDEAIAHRQREIELMERLHRDADSSGYTPSTRAYMLRGRDAGVLRERRVILEALRKANVESKDDLLRRSG